MKKEKNISLINYISKYKGWVFFYIVVTLISTTSMAFIAIIAAKAIEWLTIGEYAKSISYLLIVLAISMIKWGCWYISSAIYHKIGGLIVAELNSDLSKQSFKISSKTYSDNSSGTFVERIVNDPRRVVESLCDIVDTIAAIVSHLIIIVYIMILNLIICLVLLAILGGCLLIEFWRQRVYEKNSKIFQEVILFVKICVIM